MQTIYKAYTKLNKLYTYHWTDAVHWFGPLASPGLSWLANDIWVLVMLTASSQQLFLKNTMPERTLLKQFIC